MTTDQQSTFEEFSDIRAEAIKSARRAEETQRDINTSPRRQYAVIAAVDNKGGFAKGGKIPWRFTEDFQWFKQQTDGHACIMGRTTYEDMVEMRGEKAKDTVLPNRTSFVLSSSMGADSITNAKVIRNAWDADNLLQSDEELTKTIFFIGGEQVFHLGLSYADVIYLTVIDDDYECDQFFNTKYVETYFTLVSVFKHPNQPKLRFTKWTRARK